MQLLWGIAVSTTHQAESRQGATAPQWDCAEVNALCLAAGGIAGIKACCLSVLMLSLHAITCSSFNSFFVSIKQALAACVGHLDLPYSPDILQQNQPEAKVCYGPLTIQQQG